MGLLDAIVATIFQEARGGERIEWLHNSCCFLDPKWRSIKYRLSSGPRRINLRVCRSRRHRACTDYASYLLPLGDAGYIARVSPSFILGAIPHKVQARRCRSRGFIFIITR